MYLKLIRERHNGERITLEADNFKDNIEEVKEALNKWVPGLYTMYMCFDKHGNMVASKGLFGEC